MNSWPDIPQVAGSDVEPPRQGTFQPIFGYSLTTRRIKHLMLALSEHPAAVPIQQELEVYFGENDQGQLQLFPRDPAIRREFTLACWRDPELRRLFDALGLVVNE